MGWGGGCPRDGGGVRAPPGAGVAWGSPGGGGGTWAPGKTPDPRDPRRLYNSHDPGGRPEEQTGADVIPTSPNRSLCTESHRLHLNPGPRSPRRGTECPVSTSQAGDVGFRVADVFELESRNTGRRPRKDRVACACTCVSFPSTRARGGRAPGPLAPHTCSLALPGAAVCPYLPEDLDRKRGPTCCKCTRFRCA